MSSFHCFLALASVADGLIALQRRKAVIHKGLDKLGCRNELPDFTCENSSSLLTFLCHV